MNNGTILNNTYQIIQPIGSGGLGVIYLGYHLNLRKHVIIKKVKAHCSGLMNNRIEVDILKGLHHTYLPQVYDFIEIEGGIFTVMDYISGHDLKYYLDHGYTFSEEQLIFWIKQLCEVLSYLHSKGVIHCDIKPANIMITEEGNVCLIDFNISLDGENNKDLVGLSSCYASPEQIKKAEHKMRYGSGDSVKMDGRTDIFSLGAVFYYLMTGMRLNVREQDIQPISSIEHSYSDSLANIIDKSLALSPEKRFKSADKMLEALNNQNTWSREYRMLLKAGAILDVTAGCLAIFMIVMMIVGLRGMEQEDFFDSYDQYMAQADAWSMIQDEDGAEDLISDGIRILNQNDLFEKYEKEKSNVLFCIGQAHLHLEKYPQAENYFEDALHCNKENPEIYCSLAIVNAREGDWKQAENKMETALEYGLSKEEGKMLQAEIAMAKGYAKEAWEYAKDVIKSSDDEIALRAANVFLDAGEQLGYYSQCIEYLSHVSEETRGLQKFIWLRKQGEFCMKMIQNEQTDEFKRAIDCYEKLCESQYVQLSDLYNLVSLYEQSGKLQMEKELLLEMKEDYLDDYKVYLQLAYVCYCLQNKNAANIRDYEETQRYFEKACAISVKQGIDWKSDVNMMQMSVVIEQLKMQGWLK